MRMQLAAALLVLLGMPGAEPLAAQDYLPRSFGQLELGMPRARLQTLQPKAERYCADECLPGEEFLDLSLFELPDTRAALLTEFWWSPTPPPSTYAIDLRLYRDRLMELGLPAPTPDLAGCAERLVARYGRWWQIRLVAGRTGVMIWRDSRTILTVTFEVNGDTVLPNLRDASARSVTIADRAADSVMTIAYLRRGLIH